jgi:hypothetical protein
MPPGRCRSSSSLLQAVGALVSCHMVPISHLLLLIMSPGVHTLIVQSSAARHPPLLQSTSRHHRSNPVKDCFRGFAGGPSCELMLGLVPAPHLELRSRLTIAHGGALPVQAPASPRHSAHECVLCIQYGLQSTGMQHDQEPRQQVSNKEHVSECDVSPGSMRGSADAAGSKAQRSAVRRRSWQLQQLKHMLLSAADGSGCAVRC